MASNRITLAIGPEYNRQSWAWTGFNLARAITSYFDVTIFRPGEIPTAAVIVCVKKPFAINGYPSNLKIVYIPCDFYTSLKEVRNDPFLRRCQAVVVHSPMQRDLLAQFHPNVHYLLNDDRFVLPQPNLFREEGPIIWIGRTVHLPLLRDWLQQHPLPCGLPIVALTDKPGCIRFPGNVRQVIDTSRTRFEWMQRAKGAFELHGRTFQQIMKPLDKIHTYIASGIPAAVDGSLEVVGAPGASGFAIADTRDYERWLSRDYYEQTLAFSRVLRENMRLENVAAHFHEVVKSIL